MDKKAQRIKAKMLLSTLSKYQKEDKASLITNKLCFYLKGKVMAFMPFQDEVDISSVNNFDSFYFPVISNDDMNAYKMETYIINKYGIKEPEVNDINYIDPKKLDIVIVPLLAFDEKCNRLGRGKGYYDRFLQKCPKALKIGVAFEIQKIDDLVVDENDYQLDYIISESNIYKKTNS